MQYKYSTNPVLRKTWNKHLHLSIEEARKLTRNKESDALDCYKRSSTPVNALIDLSRTTR